RRRTHARPGVPKHQPEADAASELDSNGKERLRQRGYDVPISTDRFGHAGGLRVGLLYGFSLVDRVQGGLRDRNPGGGLGGFDRHSTVLLRHQESRAGVALLTLTLAAEPAVAR